MRFPYPNNRFVKEVYEGGCYDFSRHYPVVVDVGANIGTFSAWIYDHAEKIYAIEPVKENVEKIYQLIDMNGLNKITVCQDAISDRSYIRKMERRGNPEEGGWRIDESGDYEVSCLTLKDFMKVRGIDYIDLLKIDVEGQELPILKTPFFPYQKIGTIIGEHHYETGNELREILGWYGFKYQEFPNNYFLARR